MAQQNAGPNPPTVRSEVCKPCWWPNCSWWLGQDSWNWKRVGWLYLLWEEWLLLIRLMFPN